MPAPACFTMSHSHDSEVWRVLTNTMWETVTDGCAGSFQRRGWGGFRSLQRIAIQTREHLSELSTPFRVSPSLLASPKTEVVHKVPLNIHNSSICCVQTNLTSGGNRAHMTREWHTHKLHAPRASVCSKRKTAQPRSLAH